MGQLDAAAAGVELDDPALDFESLDELDFSDVDDEELVDSELVLLPLLEFLPDSRLSVR